MRRTPPFSKEREERGRGREGYAVTLYAAFAALLLLRVALGHAALWRTVRRATPVDGLTANGVSVRESVAIAVPCAVGWGHSAVILLPAGFAATAPADRFGAVLAHETAHLRRGDYVTQALSDAVCAAFFPNPLVWLLARVLRGDAERAADDAVIAEGTVKPSDYAAHLLNTVRDLRHGQGMPAFAVTMARHSDVRERIGAVLSGGVSRTGRISIAGMAGIVAVCALLTGGVAVLSPSRSAAQDAKTVTGANPFQQTLSDGTKVELIGMFDAAKNETRHWKPDGTPGTKVAPNDLPPDSVVKLSRNPMFVAKGNVGHGAVVRLTGGRSDSKTFAATGTIDDRSVISGFGRYTSTDGRSVNNLWLYGEFAPNAERTVIKVGVAKPQWQNVTPKVVGGSYWGWTTVINSYKSEILSSSVAFSEPKKDEKGIEITATFGFLAPVEANPVAVRLIATLENGREIVGEQEYLAKSEDSQIMTVLFSVNEPSSIRTVRMKARAYDWVTFSGVALKPKQ